MTKSWTPAAELALCTACETGDMPDGRIATQERLAELLGFSRQTIVSRLGGRKLMKSVELKREGGGKGGRSSAYKRAMARAATIRQNGAERLVRR